MECPKYTEIDMEKRIARFGGMKPNKMAFLVNLEINTTFDSISRFLILAPENEALELPSRFMTFKYEIIF